MKCGDIYKHFKGGEYTFLGISIPLQDNAIGFNKGNLLESGKAKLESTLNDIPLYDYFGLQSSGGAGLIFTDSDIPYVIYQSHKDELIWARPVDDFFGYKEKANDELVKRFSLQH